jgi:hypothetical protein
MLPKKEQLRGVLCMKDDFCTSFALVSFLKKLSGGACNKSETHILMNKLIELTQIAFLY